MTVQTVTHPSLQAWYIICTDDVMALSFLRNLESPGSDAWLSHLGFVRKPSDMLFVIPRFPTSFHGEKVRTRWNCDRRPPQTRTTDYRIFEIVSEALETSKAEGDSKTAIYEDDGSRVIPVPLFVTATQKQVIAGVYGILDEYRELVYVGMSRDIATSLISHAENHIDDVFFVKVMTFQVPAVEDMKRVVQLWILDNEVTPKGNVEEWYEVDVELARQASQTHVDLPPSEEPRISPFASDPLSTNGPQETMSLTAANIDLVLDEVRPYLIADGGNVSVQSVNCESGRVELLLEGACHSCSSATTTMQLGIEKALRDKFGEYLTEVVAVNSIEVENESSITACERALDTIRDTLRGLGAEVSVVEVDEDEVIVSFSGPNSLRYGIEKTLIQKAPGIAMVTFE